MRTTTHPGVFLKQEIMKNRDLSNNFIYKHSEINKTYWKMFFKGEVDLIDDIAFELSDKLNISIDFWVNMQNKHNETR
mgnify:CR=1 FL=1